MKRSTSMFKVSMKGISPSMLKALEKLEKLERGDTASSYGLKTSLGTLDALETRKLVKGRRGRGCVAFPHTSIGWSITEEGRKMLEKANG